MSFILGVSSGSPPLLSYPLSHKPPSHGHPYFCFPSCDNTLYHCPLPACKITPKVSTNFPTLVMLKSLLCCYRGQDTCTRCIHPLRQANTYTSLASQSLTRLVSIHTHHVPPLGKNTPVSASSVAHDTNKKLPHGLDAHRLPKHVAIVMDGNARWAQDMGLERHEGHYEGLETLIKIILLSSDYGISAFTAFIFSTENWNRSKAEVSSLMQLFENMFFKHLNSFMRYDIQVNVIGDIKQLPRSLQDTILEVQKKTVQNKGLKLSFAINYGGRYDITQACQAIARKVQHDSLKVEDISEESIENELSTSWLGHYKNPDLMIRTSGEHRISNYLLWQLAYSELIFLDTYWPALNEDLYAKAILCYQERDRRYGRRKSSKL